MNDQEKLRYPIGRYEMPSSFTDDDLSEWLQDIKSLPMRMKEMASNLNDEQLNTTYRPGGWTGKQVIHHVPDSHMNAYSRFKLVLTEDSPVIKPYFEDRWAALPDSRDTPVSTSLDLLSALHHRWSILIQRMSRADFDKYYIHPEYGKEYTLGAVCKLYAWHGRHHLAHLELLRNN